MTQESRSPSPSRLKPASLRPRRRTALQLAAGGIALQVFLLLQGLVHWRGSASVVKNSIDVGGVLWHTRRSLGSRGLIQLDGTGDGVLASSTAGELAIADNNSAVSSGGLAGRRGGSGSSSAADYLTRWEQQLDANATAGLCEGGKPLLPGVPVHVCRRLLCLWSHVLQRDVELSMGLLPLGFSSTNPEVGGEEAGQGAGGKGGSAAVPRRPRACPFAQGGQAGGAQLAGAQPLVSLVLLAGPPAEDLLAAQTFVQLFRTAHEAPSAEFIIVEQRAADGTDTGGKGSKDSRKVDRDSHSGSSSTSNNSNSGDKGSRRGRLSGGSGTGHLSSQRLLLRSTASKLGAYFGARLRLLPAERQPSSNSSSDSPRGKWADAQDGLEAAVGTYVVVLSAGTFVLRGWLHSLLSTFEAHPRAAALGPLVLARTGLVFHAGSTLWRNGTAALASASTQLEPPELHLRRVDFVGDACFALRREMALAAGGFDTRMACHHGELDLSLALQQRGGLVMLQPLSVVLSGQGSLTSRQPAELEEEGQCRRSSELFSSKWQHLPATQHCQVPALRLGMHPNSSREGYGSSSGSSSSTGGPHILWIDDTVPTPDKDSGSVRLLALIRILLEEGYRVSFQPRRDADRPYILAARAAGVRVLPAQEVALLDSDGSCLYTGFLVSRRGNYNRVYAMLDEACPGVPQVFDTVDLHFLREARTELMRRGQEVLAMGPTALVRWLRDEAPALAKGSVEAESLLRRQGMELELMVHANATLVVSEDEVQVLREFLPHIANRIYLVSNVHELPWDNEPPSANGTQQNGISKTHSKQPTPCTARRGLLFVGNMNHKPNVDAVVFLVKHVLPRVLKKLPPKASERLVVHIVGSGAIPPEVQEMLSHHAKHVRIHGYLPDDLLRMLYASVKVAVAPLTTGAGVKGKVNQAMRMGVPVVATSIAAEGIHAADGQDILVAEGAKEFAVKVLSVYQDCKLWERLARGGQANLRRHFSTENARSSLLRALAAAGVPRPQPLLCCRSQAGCGDRAEEGVAADSSGGSEGDTLLL